MTLNYYYVSLMVLFRVFALTMCFLMITGTTLAQEIAGEKLIRIADLPDKIDQEKADSYLDAVEAGIGKLVKNYQQLTSWNLKNSGKNWSGRGKIRTSDSLTYGHGLKESKSSIYLDRFGKNSLYIRLKIETQRVFARVSGSGAGSVAHGWSVAGGCLIAQITSANPRNDKLVKQLTDIIENGTSRKPCY
ncbi:hypothetical protein BH20ACI2_BH20ACI2_00010 [soil metagenome]